MRYIFTLTLIFSALGLSLQAQNAGDALFDDDVIHEIYFQFDQPNYYQLMQNNYENTPTGDRVPYIMASVEIDGELVDSVGVRFKGFTSYTEANKKPIKVDFNEFVKGKRYDGLRKINLNNGTADPALQRDIICYDMLRSLGAKAPRTAYARVYFNGELWGIYQLIEQIDKEFLKRNFGSSGGNLFKNLGWSKFEWLGNQKEPYKEIFGLKTNEEEDDWSGFINLIDVLNNSSDQAFKEEISKVLNVDLFLQALAVDVATNNWDSYLEHGRNWYIYEDLSSGLFHWLPWDYNLALGGQLGFGPVDPDACEIWPDIAIGTNGTPTVKFINTSFSFGGELTYFWDFGDGNSSTEENPTHEYEEGGVYQVCLTLIQDEDCQEIICESVDTDINLAACSTLSDPNGPSEFSDAFIITLDWNPGCCSFWGGDCEEIYGWFSGSGDGGNNFNIDQSQNEGVLIRRLLAVPEFKTQYYNHTCDLLENHFTKETYNAFINANRALIEDDVENDPNYLYSFEEFVMDSGEDGLIGYINNRIDQLNVDLSELDHTCPLFDAPIAFQDIVINEIMASADSTGTIVDPSGEHDDWIELYNNTNTALDLSGTYLSDSETNLKKWKFPTGTYLDPDAYLIIWADGDEGQVGLHCNFKLNKSQDELYFTNSDGSTIDSLSFQDEQSNIALARNPNGTGAFVHQSPTFGSNNEGVSSTTFTEDAGQVSLYPNPAHQMIYVSYEADAFIRMDISNAAGQVLQTVVPNNLEVQGIDISDLNPGFYFLRLTSSLASDHTLKFIKLE